jgi:hypothetical protein
MDLPTVPRAGLNPSVLVGILTLDGARTGRFAARVVAHVRPPGRVDMEMDIVVRRGGDHAAQGATDGSCDSGSHASSLCSLTCGSRMLRTS